MDELIYRFLVHDVVLPILSFSQEDQQLWEADPDEVTYYLPLCCVPFIVSLCSSFAAKERARPYSRTLGAPLVTSYV